MEIQSVLDLRALDFVWVPDNTLLLVEGLG